MLVGKDLAVLEGSRRRCDCGWGWRGARRQGPPKAEVPRLGLPVWAHSCPLVAAVGPAAETQEGVAAAGQSSLLGPEPAPPAPLTSRHLRAWSAMEGSEKQPAQRGARLDG